MSASKTIGIILVLITGFLIQNPLFSQARGGSRHELGYWIGATNPMPGSAIDETLDSTIAGGFFYRVDWPWVLFTEVGASYATYTSLTTSKVSIAPVYGALSYQLPLASRFQIFLKGGGGMSYVEVRPDNRVGWEPMGYAGFEFSILASRHFRIGLRLDYYNIMEQNKSRPTDQQYLLYYNLLNRSSEQALDLRYYDLTSGGYTSANGEFINFGLMMSFIL